MAERKDDLHGHSIEVARCVRQGGYANPNCRVWAQPQRRSGHGRDAPLLGPSSSRHPRWRAAGVGQTGLGGGVRRDSTMGREQARAADRIPNLLRRQNQPQALWSPVHGGALDVHVESQIQNLEHRDEFEVAWLQRERFDLKLLLLGREAEGWRQRRIAPHGQRVPHDVSLSSSPQAASANASRCFVA